MKLFDAITKNVDKSEYLTTMEFGGARFSFILDGEESIHFPEAFVTPEDFEILAGLDPYSESIGTTKREILALRRVFPHFTIPSYHPYAIKKIRTFLIALQELARQMNEFSEIRDFQEDCYVISTLIDTETITKQMKQGKYKGVKGEKIVFGKDVVFFYDKDDYCVAAIPREYINPLHFTYIATI